MKTYLSSVKITFSELKKDRATDFPLLGLMICHEIVCPQAIAFECNHLWLSVLKALELIISAFFKHL